MTGDATGVTMTRNELLETLADHIVAFERPHPVRVGIDGAAAVGKTSLADELVSPIASRGRRVIRARGDDFHNPRSLRHLAGRDSAHGYYRDAFDSAALIARLLQPLGPAGSGLFRTASHELESDRPLDPPLRQARHTDVLLFDGMFVQRPLTRDYFDAVIYLKARPEIARRRAIERDAAVLGSPEDVARMYERRYDPAQVLYECEVQPETHADFVIDNSALDAPVAHRVNSLGSSSTSKPTSKSPPIPREETV